MDQKESGFTRKAIPAKITYRLKVKEWKKICANREQKWAGVNLLISAK